MDRAAPRAVAMGEKKEGRGGGDVAAADGGPGAAASRALQQCGQLQKLIDISIGSLRGLRTKCAVSNDLTQQEIRTLEVRGPRAREAAPGTSLLPQGTAAPRRPGARVAPLRLPLLPARADAAAWEPRSGPSPWAGLGGGAEWELGWRLEEPGGGVGRARAPAASPSLPPPRFHFAGLQDSFCH